MKFLSGINEDKDIVTKEFVQNTVDNASPFVSSAEPPTNTNKIWINNGVPYYFETSDNTWTTLMFTTDINKISITDETDDEEEDPEVTDNTDSEEDTE